jgi:hypothetical protein
LGAGGWGKLDSLDDPRLPREVIRGPALGTFGVREHLFDPGRHVMEGEAQLRRRLPLLTSAGPYHLTAENRLMNRFWDHQEMGLHSSWERRIPVIYDLPRAPNIYSDAYRQAAFAILQAPFRPQLAPLDRDDEFIAYARRFGWRTGPPDFHPFLQLFCQVDHTVAQKHVAELIDRIQGQVVTDAQGNLRRVGGVPQEIVGRFIDLYTQVIRELKEQLNMGVPPPLAGSIQAEIADLEHRIDLLRQFLSELQHAVD